jgi:hypothetical protein
VFLVFQVCLVKTALLALVVLPVLEDPQVLQVPTVLVAQTPH